MDNTQQQAAGQPVANNGQKEDYLDKALDKGEQLFGKKSGHNVDTNSMRNTNEKITDGIRGAFEKATGKHVPDKYSN
ncbi:hypothetical protein AMS68_005675 [Peltaster fructicola]|uniref:Uncharacterized protein n=1 Tax=Peltaster fructicola TaxID=286661 RepID=A0A6H0XZY4_9PEZI|nr:hypothetical protein AMS68_005675 [Peltaster fructicola]